jgi:uncharacterized delta-60 repeat protein
MNILPLISQAAAGLTESGWIAALKVTGTYNKAKGIAIDADKNIYSVGISNTSYTIITKHNSDGILQWQKNLQTSVVDSFAIAIDSNKNVYITGSSGNDIYLVKYNVSGIVQWQKKLGSNAYDTSTSIVIDANDNIYVGGFVIGQDNSILVKYDVNGNSIWQKGLYISGSKAGIFGTSIDINGNVLVVGQGGVYGSAFLFLAKYNSSGILQWQRKLDTSSEDIGYGITSDSLGNIYTIGRVNGTSYGQYTLIAKYNSSGVIQWQRILDNDYADNGYSITVDSLDNIFIAGSTIDNGFIAKYNSNGNIQWQKQLSGSAGSTELYAIVADNLASIYVAGYTGGTLILAKLPKSGISLGTGNYTISGNTLIYSDSNFIESAGTVAESSSSLLLTSFDNNPWVTTLDVTTREDTANAITVDSNENVYVAGSAYNHAYSFIIKYNSSGILQWQKQLNIISITSITVDSAGNIYTTGYYTGSTQDIVLVKYSDTGSILWQRILAGAGSDRANSIKLDASNNVYIVGGSSNNTIIAKYNSSGVIQWQNSIAYYLDEGFGVTIDSTGNIYICGQSNYSSANATQAYIIKLSSAGLLQWQRFLNTPTLEDKLSSVVSDSSGNVYTVGLSSSAATTAVITILKFNSNGTLQWQRKLDTVGYLDYASGISLDSSNNLYIIGYANGKILIAKYSNNGAIQAQATLAVSGQDVTGQAIISNSKNIYICGRVGAYSNAGAYALVAKLPSDLLASTINSSPVVQTASNLVDSSGILDIITDTSNFIIALDTSGSYDSANSLVVDNSNNIYVAGQANGNGTTSYIFLIKYDSSGVIQWQKKIDSSSVDNALAITLDSSNNIYLAGHSPGGSLADALIIKFNSFGDMQWNKLLVGASNQLFYDIAVDSSGNSYTIGTSDYNDYSIIIAKYDSSGSLQWQKGFSTTGVSDVGYGIVIDSSNNSYIVGTVNSAICVIKLNTTGNIQWQRKIDVTASFDTGYAIDLDSSGNVYIVGQINDNASSYILIAKYSNSGTLTWKKYLQATSVASYGKGISVDSSGNCHIIGQTNSTTSAAIVVAKIDTSGNLLWQTIINTANSSDIGYGIDTDSNNNVYISGQLSGSTAANSYGFIAKLSGSGGLIGNSTISVYDGNLSFGDSNASESISTVTFTDTSFTENTCALTVSEGSLPQTKVITGFSINTSTLTDSAGAFTNTNLTVTSTTYLTGLTEGIISLVSSDSTATSSTLTL